MQRLHLLQGKLWPALLGTVVSYSLISDRTVNHQCSLLVKAS